MLSFYRNFDRKVNVDYNVSSAQLASIGTKQNSFSGTRLISLKTAISDNSSFVCTALVQI